jgi:hypothetical protein
MKLVHICAFALAGLLALLAACNKTNTEEAPADTTAGTAPAAGQVPAPQPAGGSPAASAAAWTGDAVNFSYMTADGESKTADSYAGKPLVLNFWAAW